MDENQIMQQITKTLDGQINDFENYSNINYDNKLVETLRKSNQIEISNIKTKYKQIFNTTIQTFLNLVQNETAKLQSQILMKNLEQISLMEYLKKKIHEQQLIISELNNDNIQLRIELQLRNQDQNNQNLILHYQKMLNDLQLELDEKNNELISKNKQILQQQLLIQTLNIRINNLEQQINQFNTQKREKEILFECKQKSIILKQQATQVDIIEEINLNQYDQLVKIQRKINQKNTFNNQSSNRSQSISLSASRQFQSKVQDCDIQPPHIIDNEFQKFQTQIQMNKSTFSNNYNQKKINTRKRQNLNDLYLYSKSQRNSRVDVDQYYEPSLLYRYNVLERIKK
ncbi:unnamed protein product [Paramecium pentaurelia]|uniref:Uncharacterized protein n=1 Tax=Paramecium pentaurelia TaxID=43138 RepID=A0A8S1SS45_9CILI|nr:unnamed protein product [Paramecium pentaurelia]